MLYKKVYKNGEGLRSAQLHRKRLDAMQNARPSSLEIWASKLPIMLSKNGNGCCLL